MQRGGIFFDPSPPIEKSPKIFESLANQFCFENFFDLILCNPWMG
jgi:hypothetical protein